MACLVAACLCPWPFHFSHSGPLVWWKIDLLIYAYSLGQCACYRACLFFAESCIPAWLHPNSCSILPCISTPIVQFSWVSFFLQVNLHLTGSAAVALHDPSRSCIELTIIATAAVQAGLPHAPCKCLQYYTHINHSTHPWKNKQTICLPTSLPENPIHSLYM